MKRHPQSNGGISTIYPGLGFVVASDCLEIPIDGNRKKAILPYDPNQLCAYDRLYSGLDPSEYLREVCLGEQYHNRVLSQYAFSDAIAGAIRPIDGKENAPPKPCSYLYDPNRLEFCEQSSLGECIGVIQDAGTVEGRNSLRFWVDHPEQRRFLENALKDGVDYKIFPVRKGKNNGMARATIYNPILNYYFKNPFYVPVERILKEGIIRGTASNAVLRTRKENKKVVSISRFGPVARQFRNFLDLNKVNFYPWDYLRLDKNRIVPCRSTWIYRPEELVEGEFLLGGFGLEKEALGLPNFSRDDTAEQLELSRANSYEVMEHFGLLDLDTPSERYQSELERIMGAIESGQADPGHLRKAEAHCRRRLRQSGAPNSDEEGKKPRSGRRGKIEWNDMKAGAQS